jgi:hypothetical protein
MRFCNDVFIKVSLMNQDRVPPAAKTVGQRLIILKHRFQKTIATPPPDYVAQWMKNWSEHDRVEFTAKMRALYDRQIQSLRASGLWDEMDKDEQDFLAAGPTEISMQSYIDGNWLSESMVCLLWALGFVPNLPSYDEQVNGKGKTHLAKMPPKLLDEKLALRPAHVIAREREIAELWHWRSRTRLLQQQGRMPEQLPGGLNLDQMLQVVSTKAAHDGLIPTPILGDFLAFGKPYRDQTPEEFSIATSIAIERHRAFNWLCGYAPGNHWAETPTNT